MINQQKDRDAYKLPFSDAEINQELLLENRAKKKIANDYYQKGRNDEYNETKNLTPEEK